MSVPNVATFATTAVVIVGLWAALGAPRTSPAPKVYVAEAGPRGERRLRGEGSADGLQRGRRADLRRSLARIAWRPGA